MTLGHECRGAGRDRETHGSEAYKSYNHTITKREKYSYSPDNVLLSFSLIFGVVL